MWFCCIVLASSWQQVKDSQELDESVFEAYCFKPNRTCRNATTEGHSESNAWGESHLWARRRKESSLSGFVEPRIPRLLSVGVSIGYDYVGLENQGLPLAQIRQRITQVLAELNITHLRDRLTDQLSGGQKQACVLAAILALDTPIIVLDEPIAALDPAGKQLVGQVVERLKALGKTLIVSDPNLEWFQHLVDQTLVLSPDGRLLYSGELRESLSNRALLEQSHIPRPALTDLSFALQQSGYDLPVWVEFAEANRWISTVLGAGKATTSTATGHPARAGLLSPQGEQSALPSAYGSRAPVEFARSAPPSVPASVPPSAPVVDCVDLTFTYADAPTPALSAVSFSANAGQLLGIIGQNGSGKSTAVRHLNGLLRPQTGVVMVSG